jgi:hypothetical protein
MLRMGGAIPPPFHTFIAFEGTIAPFLSFITSFMRGVKLQQINNNINNNVRETDKCHVEWENQIYYQ